MTPSPRRGWPARSPSAETVDAGDCVVGLFHQRGRIEDGGAWVEAPVGAVLYMRDGKVVRAMMYFSWSEALQAAGVQE